MNCIKKVMEDETAVQYSEEATEIAEERLDFLERYYPLLRDSYQNPYGWPKLDPVRHEAALSVMLGLFQAGITLTNHLLESLLKLAVIIESSDPEEREENPKDHSIDSFMKDYEEAQDKYGDENLHNNIGKAYSLGLIDDDQKETLHEIREKLRNAYGHADKSKTFGDLTIPVQSAHLDEGKLKVGQRSEPKVADLLVGQGIIQAKQAEATAPEYFLYIDSLAREIREKLFGPIEDPFEQIKDKESDKE